MGVYFFAKTMDDYNGSERRTISRTDPLVAILSSRMETLHQDVGDIKNAMNTLSAAVTKLALVEERQANATAALDRAFKAIYEVERRLVEIEKKVPEYSKASIWIDRGIWGAAAAAVVYVAKKVGLI